MRKEVNFTHYDSQVRASFHCQYLDNSVMHAAQCIGPCMAQKASCIAPVCRLAERLASANWSQQHAKPEIKILRYGYEGFYEKVSSSTKFLCHCCQELAVLLHSVPDLFNSCCRCMVTSHSSSKGYTKEGKLNPEGLLSQPSGSDSLRRSCII